MQTTPISPDYRVIFNTDGVDIYPPLVPEHQCQADFECEHEAYIYYSSQQEWREKRATPSEKIKYCMGCKSFVRKWLYECRMCGTREFAITTVMEDEYAYLVFRLNRKNPIQNLEF